MTTQAEIGQWFDEGRAQNATHMIVMVDTFDHEDYPVYVFFGQNAMEECLKRNDENMQRVMECYDLFMDKDTQVNTRDRVFNY